MSIPNLHFFALVIDVDQPFNYQYNTSTMSTLGRSRISKTEGAGPRYEQIGKAVCGPTRLGELKPGDQLPTVRALASDLGVSLTT